MVTEKYSSSKELIRKQLSIIIFNKRTRQMLKNEQFLNVVIKNISILKKIEELSTSEKEKIIAYKCLDRINVELVEKKTFISYELPNLPSELNDEVKFLDSLAINLFGKNLEEIKVLASDPSSVLPFDTIVVEEPDTNSTNSNNSKETNNSNKNTSKSYDYGYNDAVQKEQIIMQMATKRFMEEVSSGKVYLYLSKPKAIPVIKYAVSTFYGLIALLNLALVIFFAYISISDITYDVYVKWPDGIQPPPTSPDPDMELVNIFERGLFSLIINIIFIIVFPLVAVKNLKGINTNDNVKYSMSLFLLSFLSILGLFNIIQNLGFAGNNPFPILEAARNNPAIAGQDMEPLKIYEAYIILETVAASISVMGFAFIIPYMMLRPKRNIKLQQDLLNQYKEEIKLDGIVK